MEWVSPDGAVRCVWRRPRTAGDVLGARARLAAPLAILHREARPTPPELAADLVDWLAAHTERVEQGEDTIDGEGVASALDGWLGVREMADYLRAVLDGAGLPAIVATHTGRALEVLVSGGCECRHCDPSRVVDAEDARDARCRYHAIAPEAIAVVDAWWPIRERVTMESPPWALELATQHERALLRVQSDRQRAQERREHSRQRLRQRGLI